MASVSACVHICFLASEKSMCFILTGTVVRWRVLSSSSTHSEVCSHCEMLLCRFRDGRLVVQPCWRLRWPPWRSSLCLQPAESWLHSSHSQQADVLGAVLLRVWRWHLERFELLCLINHTMGSIFAVSEKYGTKNVHFCQILHRNHHFWLSLLLVYGSNLAYY